MSRNVIVHFVCDVTHKLTGNSFQKGVTLEFRKETFEQEGGFDYILLNGIVEGKKVAARSSIPTASLEDFESRVTAFQIIP